MKPSLQLRQSQQLALTPQLQQSIRLLQLSTLELNQEIEQALADNPLLERLDDPFADCVRVAASGSLDGRASSPAAESDSAPRDDESEAREADWSAERWDDGDDGDFGGDWSSDGGRALADDDERDYPQLAATATSLREHLGEQLAATRCTARDRALVQLMIDALDDDGFLESSPEEVAAMLPPELDVSEDELATALRLLQSFDPAGVGASDLQSACNCNSIADWPKRRRPVRASARDTAPGARDRRPPPRIAGLEGFLPPAARAALRRRSAARCAGADPAARPATGAEFGSEHAGFVVPDVIARRVRGTWIATLNPSVMPKLRVNDAYAQCSSSIAAPPRASPDSCRRRDG